jgi:hypothetical protein
VKKKWTVSKIVKKYKKTCNVVGVLGEREKEKYKLDLDYPLNIMLEEGDLVFDIGSDIKKIYLVIENKNRTKNAFSKNFEKLQKSILHDIYVVNYSEEELEKTKKEMEERREEFEAMITWKNTYTEPIYFTSQKNFRKGRLARTAIRGNELNYELIKIYNDMVYRETGATGNDIRGTYYSQEKFDLLYDDFSLKK